VNGRRLRLQEAPSHDGAFRNRSDIDGGSPGLK
jgi:hypothetical protein